MGQRTRKTLFFEPRTNKNMKMTVEIKRHGFELLNEQGEIVMTSEPANKGKLHRWLSNNGFKPSAKTADLWEK
jgi:hypothetical protein